MEEEDIGSETIKSHYKIMPSVYGYSVGKGVWIEQAERSYGSSIEDGWGTLKIAVKPLEEEELAQI
jgi:hypothetical protein